MSRFSMDSVERTDGWIHVIVEPLQTPTASAGTHYNEVKKQCVQYSMEGFLINISPETLEKIYSGEIQEITV